MKVPINNFTDDQMSWYALLLAKAMIIDKSLHSSEEDFLLKAFYFLEENERKEIQQAIIDKNIPFHLLEEVPNGFSPTVLASIISEVAHLIAADGRVDSTEKKFLMDLANLLGFDSNFLESILEWCNQAMNLEKRRKEIIEGYAQKQKRSKHNSRLTVRRE
ncbi:MAG: hypothetical protein ACI86H_000970 [bacterium]|jgi:hypothetical protein